MTLNLVPWWWEGTALVRDEGDPAPLPRRVDVAIVGAGLSGLTAAAELARAGRSVVVLDAGRPGSGASSRNGGMLGRSFKHSFGELMEERGLDVAIRYFRELGAVYAFAARRAEAFGVEAGYRPCGRVIGAVSPAHRERLFREWELRARHAGEVIETFDHPGAAELPTRRYVAGVHVVHNAAVHPGRYTMAHLREATDAGASVIGRTPVLDVAREGGDFTVRTPRGAVAARDVLIASNGYTTRRLPRFFRRLSPIDAFMIATAPGAAARLPRLRAGGRTYHDNRRNSNYYSLSDDGRLVFGGRTGLFHRSLPQMARKLRGELLLFFPELADLPITHAWTGRCAATGDVFPHVGVQDGMHFAVGYCFSGLAMAPYLGHKAARRILGDAAGAETIFMQDGLDRVAWPKRQTPLIRVAMHYWRLREPLPKPRSTP